MDEIREKHGYYRTEYETETFWLFRYHGQELYEADGAPRDKSLG